MQTTFHFYLKKEDHNLAKATEEDFETAVLAVLLKLNTVWLIVDYFIYNILQRFWVVQQSSRWGDVQVEIGLAVCWEGGLYDGTDGRDCFTGEEFTVKVRPIREVDTYLGMGVDLGHNR